MIGGEFMDALYGLTMCFVIFSLMMWPGARNPATSQRLDDKREINRHE